MMKQRKYFLINQPINMINIIIGQRMKSIRHRKTCIRHNQIDRDIKFFFAKI